MYKYVYIYTYIHAHTYTYTYIYTQYFRFYIFVQMTQIFDGNMKITLQRNLKLN